MSKALRHFHPFSHQEGGRCVKTRDGKRWQAGHSLASLGLSQSTSNFRPQTIHVSQYRLDLLVVFAGECIRHHFTCHMPIRVGSAALRHLHSRPSQGEHRAFGQCGCAAASLRLAVRATQVRHHPGGGGQTTTPVNDPM